jgi:hypothetical protein
VELGRLFEHVNGRIVQAEGPADHGGILADAEDVVPRVVVAQLSRAGQTVDHFLPRRLQLVEHID